jgi:hypothetical protein
MGDYLRVYRVGLGVLAHGIGKGTHAASVH